MVRGASRGGGRVGRATMRKYTYIDKRTGQRVYSDTPLDKPYLKKVTEIRGGAPRGMEKVGVAKSTEKDSALDGSGV